MLNKVGNTWQKLLNNVIKIIYSSYQSKGIIKKLYINIIVVTKNNP